MLEIAATLFAGIQAVAAAIDVWQSSRSKRRAADAFDERFQESAQSNQAQQAAEELVHIIPEDVVRDLEKRAETCWTRFRKVLGGDFLPDEVDEATDSVRLCVCRELSRIKKLTGEIPDRWREQWDLYECRRQFIHDALTDTGRQRGTSDVRGRSDKKEYA